jgi:probable HAF family extracellular repeat protein
MSAALSYETIDPPGSTYSVAEEINEKGQIVGFFQNSNRQEYGFLDSGGTYTTIQFPGSIQTLPPAIEQFQQRALIDRELLQRRALDARHVFENYEGSAQIVQLWHGALR